MREAIPLATGLLSGIISGDFKQVEKVEYQPPAWVFGVVWPILYVLMGLSISGLKTVPTIFWVQLALNFIWSPIYVRLNNPSLALLVLAALWVTTLMTIVELGPRGRLLYPYIIWLTFAFFLNYRRVVMLRDGNMFKSLP